MNELINNLTNNPLVQIISFFIGLMGVILAIVFYVKSKKKRKPYYAKRSFNIISEKIKKFDKINITYDEKSVENLTVTKIAFWNGGNETINYSDFAIKNKLKIKPSKNIQVFDAKIIFKTDKVCSAALSVRDNEIFVDFDYFDFQQGFVVQLTHSGKSSNDVSIDGTIKGCGRLMQKEESFDNHNILINLFPLKRKLNQRKAQNFAGWFCTFVCIAMVIMGFMSKDLNVRLLIYIFGIIYGILGFTFLFLRSSMPKGFYEIIDN